jgi:hypothetical protein
MEKYSTARQDAEHNIIRPIQFAYWLNNATDPHSAYIILIAFPRQQWFHERALMLRSCVHCLSFY